jgi:YegS/Rv2252/BmrU family lipid kinase
MTMGCAALRAPGAGQSLRRIVVIYNPAAGHRHKQSLVETLGILREARHEAVVLATERSGDAERFAATIDRSRFDVVVAAGGDGTINEVVNGLTARAPPLAIMPLGTANVFAREIAAPTMPRAIAAAIAGSTPRPIYFGVANGRRFLQMAGIGFDATVVEGLDPRLKRQFGRGAYGMEIFRQWLQYRPRHYRLIVDGRTYDGATIVVANGRYYGGEFVISPRASVSRNDLEVCIFLRASRAALSTYLLALGRGSLARRSDVCFLTASAIDIAGDEAEPVQLDGDIRCTLPCRIRTSTHALQVLTE